MLPALLAVSLIFNGFLLWAVIRLGRAADGGAPPADG